MKKIVETPSINCQKNKKKSSECKLKLYSFISILFSAFLVINGRSNILKGVIIIKSQTRVKMWIFISKFIQQLCFIMMVSISHSFYDKTLARIINYFIGHDFDHHHDDDEKKSRHYYVTLTSPSTVI